MRGPLLQSGCLDPREMCHLPRMEAEVGRREAGVQDELKSLVPADW